jgi:hypothetical protein
MPDGQDPFQPPQWSSDYFRDEVAVTQSGRGMVGHVRVVAILLIVQGVFEILFAFFCVAVFVMSNVIPDPELETVRKLSLVMVMISVPALACGVLRMVAGYFNFRFRKRGLGLVALGAGLVTVMTFYCAATSIALSVYGLIVYLNEAVVAAFEAEERKRSVSR